MRPTALVTGGGSDIGRAVVAALRQDAWVAAVDVAFPEEALPADSRADVDVTDRDALKAAIDRITGERDEVTRANLGSSTPR